LLAAKRIEVRPSIVSDVYTLAANLRPLDHQEVTAFGAAAKVVLRKTYRDAILRRTYLVDGAVAAMSGLCGGMLSDVGEPYLLTSPLAASVPVALVKLAANAVQEMLTHRSRLEGHVAANYHQACRLLLMLGFTLGEPQAFGNAMFRKFTKRG
jgi:hypothetical protein